MTNDTASKLIWGEWYRNKETGTIQRYCPLHPGQKKIWNSTARFLFYIGGKMVGKSSFAPLWLESEILKAPKGKFILCAPTNKVLNQGLMDEFFRLFKSEHCRIKGKWQAQEKEFRLDTGGVIYVRSLDDPETINGIHANAIVVDEAGLLPADTWRIIESRVAGKLGRVLCITTPYKGKRWLMKFVDRAKAGDPDLCLWNGASTVNPSFSQAEFNRLRKQAIEENRLWQFEMDYEGKFTIPSEAIFSTLAKCEVPMPDGGLPPGKFVGSIDWGGGRDPAASYVGLLDHEDCLWLFWERYKRDEDIQSTYQGLKKWHNEFYLATGRKVTRWHCDTQKILWKGLRKHKVSDDDTLPKLNARSAFKGAGSLELGINLVNARIRTGRLKIIQGTCPALLSEAELYRYKVDSDGDGSGVPTGPDHACDSIRYLVMGIDRKRATKG